MTVNDCQKNINNDNIKGALPDSTHRIETASHGPVEESGHPITSPLRPPPVCHTNHFPRWPRIGVQ